METLTPETTETSADNITTARPEFHITDAASANWFLRRLAGIESEKARVKAQAAQITSQLDADANSLRSRYEAEAREWAREELAKKGNRR